MVLRHDERGVIAIGQASHAWISGQLARAWGNERFPPPDPHEEVCLAAEQHDVGMAAWDLAPTRNPETGLPHSFIEMPVSVHLELWRNGPPRLRSQSRYAALLASMHGSRLYELRDLTRLSSEHVDEVRAFLAEQRDFQQQLLRSLHGDEATRAAATPDAVARNSQLIWIWDFLSLALCLDWAPCTAHAVPGNDGPVELNVEPGPILDPWPFADATRPLTVRCEGRRLTGRYDTDEELTAALAAAPWETVVFEPRAR